MKKMILILIVIISVNFLLTGCEIVTDDILYNDGDSRKYISKLINIELPEDASITDSDTHGGNGDGTYFAKVTFPGSEAESIFNLIKANSWQELPLRKDIDVFIYSEKTKEYKYESSLAGRVELPIIENGYWYFNDRSVETSEDLIDRYSNNFELSIFDTDTNILYVYKFDS